MVGKEDWKTVDMPEQIEYFTIERNLTNDELTSIKEGLKPQVMEDKWFMYYETGKLFIHRSWTGYCIYIVDLSKDGKLQVTVNNDPEQHVEYSLASDKLMVTILINTLIRDNSENGKLMQKYIKQREEELMRKHIEHKSAKFMKWYNEVKSGYSNDSV